MFVYFLEVCFTEQVDSKQCSIVEFFLAQIHELSPQHQQGILFDGYSLLPN